MSQATHDLAALATEWAQSLSDDLSGMVSRQVSATAAGIEEGARDAMLGASGTLVHTGCTTQDDAAQPVGLVMPIRAALALATVQLGKGPEEFEVLAASGLEGEVAEAHKVVMDLCVGILGRVFAEEASLPGLQLGESTSFEAGAASDTPAAGSYRRARFDLAIEGFPKERIDLLIPAATAADWFGRADDSGATHQVAPDGPIALLDPCEESRQRFSEVASELEREARTIDPTELSEEIMDELSEVAALVLEWDLGGKSGLELLARLRADPRTSSLRVAMTAEKPTRLMLEAALRWGADSFLWKPYEATEIATRLLESGPRADS